MPGNQYESRRADLMDMLRTARELLRCGDWLRARYYLSLYRTAYALAPASTRRRWKCGR